MIKKWWEGPWWRVFFTLRLWFLLVLVGGPILFIFYLLNEESAQMLAMGLFWMTTLVIYIFWRIWTKSAHRKTLRFSFGALALLAWLIGGSSLPLLMTGGIDWLLAVIGLLIGIAAFYAANMLYKAVKTKQLIDSALPIVTQIIQKFGGRSK